MGRIKPAALLQQSKKKKGVAKSNFAAIGAGLIVVVLVVFLVPSIRKRAAVFKGTDEAAQSTAAAEGVASEKTNADGSNPPQRTRIVMHTSKGEIRLELFASECPKTVENFVALSKKGYYDGLTFHRVIKGFMIQGGDPSGDGTGGASIWGGNFEDEFRATLKHEPYTLAMANGGPDTNGSQFFITTVATPWLDGKHTVFGCVTAGVEVLQAIEAVATDGADKPLEAVKILKMEVEDASL
eukprot:jgi/Mesen1/7641/ME000004S07910